MARPRKYTNEEIVAALKKTRGMVYLAASKVGCDADTIYYRAKTCKAIDKAIQHERGKLLDIAESKLLRALVKSEPWAIQFALKTIGRSRGYAESTVLLDLQTQLAELRSLINAHARDASTRTQ